MRKLHSKNGVKSELSIGGGLEKMTPKKTLGQNFLTSEAAIHKIIATAKILPGETVLEVGPGRGALTKALIASGARVVAVEKDHQLCEELSAKFSAEIGNNAGNSRLKIVEGDIMKISPEDIGLGKVRNSFSENSMDGHYNGDYKIVANIPYYITGQFLRKFLSAVAQPTSMVLLLQKEVVERIIAGDKKESLLSISVKAYGQPKKITVVKRGSFFPAPNVDSAIIVIENISKKIFGQISEGKFFEIVRAGFAHKRKMLVPNLVQATKGKLTVEKNLRREKILKLFAECDISEKIRAENLQLEQWKQIADKID